MLHHVVRGPVKLIQSEINAALRVLQEEAAKPKTVSCQRLSPKWCFLDCKYITFKCVISPPLALLPD